MISDSDVMWLYLRTNSLCGKDRIYTILHKYFKVLTTFKNYFITFNEFSFIFQRYEQSCSNKVFSKFKTFQ